MEKFSFDDLEKKMGFSFLYSFLTILIIINLFFIQALRFFLSGIYVSVSHVAFGEDTFTNSLMLILFLFLFLPVLTSKICKKLNKRSFMLISVYIIGISRIIIAIPLQNTIKAIFSGLIVTFYGFFISIFISLWLENKDKIDVNHKIILYMSSILFALLLDYSFRTIGLTQDITLLTPGMGEDWRITQYYWLVIQIPLSFLLIFLSKRYLFSYLVESKITYIETKNILKVVNSLYSVIFMGIGIILFLFFNLFLYPNSIAQISGTNYYINNILSIISLITALIIIFSINIKKITKKNLIVVFNAFLIISLIIFFFFGKILSYISVLVINISLIILYIDLFILLHSVLKINFKWDKIKTVSYAITIAYLVFILFTLIHIFTTEWSFTVYIFKGLGPYVMIIATIFLSISIFFSIKLSEVKNEQKS